MHENKKEEEGKTTGQWSDPLRACVVGGNKVA